VLPELSAREEEAIEGDIGSGIVCGEFGEELAAAVLAGMT
jgi:hypothetical protein